jgi:hypothetical protein
MNQIDNVQEIIRSLEAEAEKIRNLLAAKMKAVTSARALLDLLRGDTQVEASPKVYQPNIPKAKGKKNRLLNFPMHDVQTALVKFAIDRQTEFSTEEAMRHLLKQGVLPHTSSSITFKVRSLLNDSTFFDRYGERHMTRYSAGTNNNPTHPRL